MLEKFGIPKTMLAAKTFDESFIDGQETETVVLCLQQERIKSNQEKKRKPPGLLQPNPDRPSSGRRAPRQNSADLIGSDRLKQAATSDNQFGELSLKLSRRF